MSELVRIVNNALGSATDRAGKWLVCRPGCSPCCHGTFEISALDGDRLRQGLVEAAPEVRERIAGRVHTARERLASFFPGDLQSGVLTGDDRAIELFEEWAHADACPVLDPATQTCDLYAARPVLCRTFGPPIRNDHEDVGAGLAICELCFAGASEADVLHAEMDSSFRGLQERLEAEFELTHPGLGRTTVAFCFGS